jgi:hypothetical protein
MCTCCEGGRAHAVQSCQLMDCEFTECEGIRTCVNTAARTRVSTTAGTRVSMTTVCTAAAAKAPMLADSAGSLCATNCPQSPSDLLSTPGEAGEVFPCENTLCKTPFLMYSTSTAPHGKHMCILSAHTHRETSVN